MIIFCSPQPDGIRNKLLRFFSARPTMSPMKGKPGQTKNPSETKIHWLLLFFLQNTIPRTETVHLVDPWITFVGNVRVTSSEMILPVDRTDWISTQC